MEDDVTKDLAEFALSNAIFAALVESHACEISSRYVAFLVSSQPMSKCLQSECHGQRLEKRERYDWLSANEV